MFLFVLAMAKKCRKQSNDLAAPEELVKKIDKALARIDY
jgi:hypothetical protein